MRRVALLPALALMAAAGGCTGGYGGSAYGPGWGYAGDPYPAPYDQRWRGDRRGWDAPPANRQGSARPIPAPPQNPALGARPETPQQPYDPPVWHQGRWIGPTLRDNSPAVGN